MEIVDQLINYGALGVMLAGFLLGWVVSKSTHDRETERANRAEDQRDSVLDDVLTKVAPALERAAEAAKTRAAYEDDMHSVLTDVVDVLTDVRRLLENGHRP